MDDHNFDEQTAIDWIDVVEKSGKSFREEFVFPKINKVIFENSPQTILEIGCGQGICSDGIEFNQRKYSGVEPSPYLLQRAKHIFPQPEKEFVLGNAYALPISDQTCDLVFSVMVWHLLSDLNQAVLELSRVLKKTAPFLIFTANPEASAAWIDLYPDAKIEGKRIEGTMSLGNSFSRDVIYLHQLEEFKSSFEKHGLRIDQLDVFPKSESSRPSFLLSIQGRKLD